MVLTVDKPKKVDKLWQRPGSHALLEWPSVNSEHVAAWLIKHR